MSAPSGCQDFVHCRFYQELRAEHWFECANQPSVPVAMGAAKPLLGPLPRLADGVHGSDGQGNTNLPPPSLKATGEHAADQIIRLAHEHPNELILVPTGPMTNIGLALARDP